MDNPVEVAFTPEGEPLATVDILISRPSRIDAIIYAHRGRASIPTTNRSWANSSAPATCSPPSAQLGWVAPAGLMRYRGEAFGAEYRDNLFSAQFNTQRIQRHPVERDGAAFRLRNEDFLVSNDPDFHPTDVLEDADGSLLVIDTGGWFRIGCPTSQIAKPEIDGAIYRVRRTGAVPPADPRGRELAWDELTPAELARLLDDPRFCRAGPCRRSAGPAGSRRRCRSSRRCSARPVRPRSPQRRLGAHAHGHPGSPRRPVPGAAGPGPERPAGRGPRRGAQPRPRGVPAAADHGGRTTRRPPAAPRPRRWADCGDTEAVPALLRGLRRRTTASWIMR